MREFSQVVHQVLNYLLCITYSQPDFLLTDKFCVIFFTPQDVKTRKSIIRNKRAILVESDNGLQNIRPLSNSFTYFPDVTPVQNIVNFMVSKQQNRQMKSIFDTL